MDNSISRSIKFEKFDCESVLPNYNCPYCGFIANLWITLREHLWNHQESLQQCRRSEFIVENYSCKNCDFISHSLLVGIAHERKCTFLMKHKGMINGCEDSEPKTKGKHFRENVIYHKCSHCSFKTPHRSYLRVHNMRRHTDSGKITWFQCDKCKYKTKIKRDLCKHIKGRHIPKNHKCSYCPFTTAYLRILKRHVTALHTEELNWFKCDECEYKSEKRYNLIQHINRKHARENLQHYECSQCLFKTTTKSNLKKHIIIRHTKAEDIEWFKCNKCEYKSKRKGNLKKHVIIRHPHEDLPHYECSQCYFKTTVKWGLNRHVIRSHTRPKEIKWFDCESVLANYNCTYCCFTTDLWITSREHVCNRHEDFQNISRKSEFNVENYSCKNCDFTSYSSLVTLAHERMCGYKNVDYKTKRTHFRKYGIYHQCSYCSFKTLHQKYMRMHNIRRHTSLRDITWFQCNECEFKAKAKHDLDAHIKRIHFRKGRNCSYCPFTTTCRRSLKRHVILRHTNPEEINWFSCGQCDFKAKLKNYLDVHIRRKHMREGHNCSYCPFTTTSQNILKRHIILRHTDPEEINWFKCDECGYKAKQKCSLTLHVDLRHRKPEDIKWFKCDECEYKSTRKDNIEKHINVIHLRQDLP